MKTFCWIKGEVVNQHWLFQMVLSIVACHVYCAIHKQLIQFHIICADYKESVLTFMHAYFYKEVIQLLPLSPISFLSFLPRSRFFYMNHFFIFSQHLLFCLAKFWGPLNNLEGNLGKKQNRSWIGCLSPLLHSFRKTKETFQKSSKRRNRTFGADVTLWHVTANEW